MSISIMARSPLNYGQTWHWRTKLTFAPSRLSVEPTPSVLTEDEGDLLFGMCEA